MDEMGSKTARNLKLNGFAGKGECAAEAYQINQPLKLTEFLEIFGDFGDFFTRAWYGKI